MFPRFFINRPIFATVLSIIIVISGLLAMQALPVAQYPDIIPPAVVVSANYPGSSAEILASSVAAPLEQEINGVPGMIYMNSTSSNSGQMDITITFDSSVDPDQATIDVNNRVQSAISRLPEEVRRQGVKVKKRSNSILEVITMFSPNSTYDPIFISNYALFNVLDELKRTKGVGDATLFGAKDYSMRIWFKPDKLAQYKLTPNDIVMAVREQNSQFAAGQLGQEPMYNQQDFAYTITTKGRFSEVTEFENIIIRADKNGSVLRLKDLARIELGAQDYSFLASYNGKPSIAIGIYLQPGANALEVTDAVNVTMKRLSKKFPEGIEYIIPFDTTQFVKHSINEVIKTFFEAIILVIIVVYLFLQNARATLIPLLAIPVSLIGTLAGMYIFGFSINLLTLFGMVLSIGIVVDDAIVVLENVERIMSKEGLLPKEATIKAMDEVTSPIIAIVLVLCAVFIPVGFMGGMTGEMYKQFAITIALSVTISGVVALTLTPALCALLLKPKFEEPYEIFNWFNDWFDRATNFYMKSVRFFLKRVTLGIVFIVGLTALTIFIFTKIPKSLVPEEDQGFVLSMPMLLPSSSLSRTVKVTDEINNRLLQQPEVSDIVTFAGFDMLSSSPKTSAGISFIRLKDWDERKKPESSAKALSMRIMGLAADIKDAIVLSFVPPPITGISLTGGFEGYLQNRSGADINTIATTAHKIVAAANKRPELAGVQTTISTNVPQYYVEVNREKAKALNVSIDSIFSAMQSSFGNLYLNDFSLYGRIFRVSLQAEAESRENSEDLRHIFTKSNTGVMVPLSSLITMNRIIGPDLVNRFNVFPAAKIMGGPAPGYSSGQAIDAMEQVVANSLSQDYSLAWTGEAYQTKKASSASGKAFTFAIIMVFLILAAQYERWSLPMVVIITIPFAIFGAVLTAWFRGLNNDVYFQVGILTLIGLGAKNAILILEFAILRRKAGASLIESALEAAGLRFRPIVMTSLAFILGCIPLAISTGAGAASRHSIGTGVIGGMVAATIITPIIVPMLYKIVAEMSEKFIKRKDPK